MIRKISGCFTGGVIGALADSFISWILAKAGIIALLGISLQPNFVFKWIYPHLIWGGLWGLLFLLPISQRHPINKGLLLSLVPSAVMLLVIFPDMGKGFMGVGFGILTPVLVVLLNFIWGMAAAIWYKHAR